MFTSMSSGTVLLLNPGGPIFSARNCSMGDVNSINSCPAKFLISRLKIQATVIGSAWCSDVRTMLVVGSSYIYKSIRRDLCETLPCQHDLNGTGLMLSACRRSLGLTGTYSTCDLFVEHRGSVQRFVAAAVAAALISRISC